MHVSRLGVPFVSLLSASLAAGGVHAILGRSQSYMAALDTLGEALPLVSPALLSWLVALLLGGTLQLLLINGWRAAFRERILGQAFLGLVFSLASAFTSATTFVFLQREGELTANIRAQASAPVVEAMRAASANFRKVADQALDLARIAEALRRTEKESGGTCEGTPAQPGAGPRMRLRERHAATFNELASRFDALAQRMLRDSLGIAKMHPAEAQSLYNDTILFMQSGDVRALAGMLTDARRDLTEGFTDPETGKRLTCATPDFAAAIAAMETHLAQTTNLAPVTIPARSAHLGDSLSMILADLDAWWSAERQTSTFGRNALLLALLVEALQVLMLRMGHAHEARSGMIPPAEERFLEGSRPTGPRFRKLARRMVEVLDQQVTEDGGRQFLVTSAGALSQGERDVIMYFDLRRRRGAYHDVPLGELMPEWLAARRDILSGDRFDIYPLPRSIDKWRRLAWRDLLDDDDGADDFRPTDRPTVRPVESTPQLAAE